MPLQFDTAEVISETIDTLEINSFAVDIERAEIHVAYDKGHLVGGAFVPVVRDLMLTIPESEFAAAIAEADVAAAGMGTVSVFGAIKVALYGRIQTMTGISGTVM